MIKYYNQLASKLLEIAMLFPPRFELYLFYALLPYLDEGCYYPSMLLKIE